MTTITATTESDVIDAVRAAREAKTPLAIVGNGTKQSFGRPTNTSTTLDVSRLNGIVDYRPEELIITAKPGTPVADIAAALAEKNQRLGFDPPDLGPLFGAAANKGTIGGAISADLNGPAALRYGRVRDHLLGIRAVNGLGDSFKAGGKVVKNVTGFDIPKLYCGAFGTLGVLTEITLRVFPKPPSSATFAVKTPTPEAGLALLRRIWSSPLEPTGLALLPDNASGTTEPSGNLALVRLEGDAAPLAEKCAALRKLLDAATFGEREDDGLLTQLGAGRPFVGERCDVWRVTVPPANAAALVHLLKPAFWYADWAGGLLWLGMNDNTKDIHAIAARHDAHATLVRASETAGNTADPFPPLSPERLALTRSVKAAFDPLGLFNPGRMVSGI